MKIKLAEGRRLRDPFTRVHLRADEVRDVVPSMFWRRRLRDGDVVVVEEEKPAEAEDKAEAQPPAETAAPAETASY